MLPSTLKEDFKEDLKKNNVSPRKKSKYFERRLREFLKQTDKKILSDLLQDGLSQQLCDASDVFSIGEEAGLEVDGVIYRIKQLDHLIEGLQSRIIRSTLKYSVEEGSC